jgi:uncharacterized membrane protein (UPF0127 family)
MESKFNTYNKFQLFESFCEQSDIDNKTINIKIGSIPFKTKIASTIPSLLKGYQDEQEPIDNEGILFIYPSPLPLSFWMKGVSFPLDILFFNSNKELVGYETMSPDDPKMTYKSPVPCQYALETRAGWCKDNIEDISNFKLNI